MNKIILIITMLSTEKKSPALKPSSKEQQRKENRKKSDWLNVKEEQDNVNATRVQSTTNASMFFSLVIAISASHNRPGQPARILFS